MARLRGLMRLGEPRRAGDHGVDVGAFDDLGAGVVGEERVTVFESPIHQAVQSLTRAVLPPAVSGTRPVSKRDERTIATTLAGVNSH